MLILYLAALLSSFTILNCFSFVLFLDVIRPLCQLQTETDSFIPFHPVCLLFPLAFLCCPRLPVLYWTQVVNTDTLALLPILGKNIQSFNVSILLAVGFLIGTFLSNWGSSPHPLFFLSFIVNNCWILSNDFSVLIYMIMWFFFSLLIQWISLIDFKYQISLASLE